MIRLRRDYKKPFSKPDAKYSILKWDNKIELEKRDGVKWSEVLPEIIEYLNLITKYESKKDKGQVQPEEKQS